MDLVVEQVEAEARLRLRLEIQLPLEGPDLIGCLQARRQSPILLSVTSTPEVRALSSTPFQRAVPIIPADRDGCICRLLPRPTRPSPLLRRVGIRIYAFETCSGFTRVTARWIAQPPKAAFVTRLRSSRLPG
jgi:hypothetical protein